MTDRLPPQRDLPPGRLEARRRHLLAEIHERPVRRRRERPALAAAGAAACATALAYALVPSAGRETAPPAHPRYEPAYSVHLKFPITSPVPGEYFPGGDTADHLAPSPAYEYRLARAEGVPAVVLAQARREAKWSGDPHPTSAEWVRTTRQRAVSSQSSDRVDSPGRQVWFVVLDGRFVDRHAYFIGRHPPRGTVLSFTIDVQRRIVLDLALGRTSPDYSVTGKPHAFRLGGSSR